jgi:hypothetical protein
VLVQWWGRFLAIVEPSDGPLRSDGRGGSAGLPGARIGFLARIAEPTAEGIAERIAEPTAEGIAERIAEPTAEGIAERIAEPTARKTSETTAEKE